MARTAVFTDATTRNRPYSVFWMSKRPEKWSAQPYLRTLRHEIGPTECSGCPSVRRNGPHRCFYGRYNTNSQAITLPATRQSLYQQLSNHSTSSQAITLPAAKQSLCQQLCNHSTGNQAITQPAAVQSSRPGSSGLQGALLCCLPGLSGKPQEASSRCTFQDTAS